MTLQSDQIGYPVSEDCLYLNVVRPSGYENQSLPVGVWIHGGGLTMGGTRDERYNLTFIVENSVKIGKPIMAVSIAYRLAVWGFISSAEVNYLIPLFSGLLLTQYPRFPMQAKQT